MNPPHVLTVLGEVIDIVDIALVEIDLRVIWDMFTLKQPVQCHRAASKADDGELDTSHRGSSFVGSRK
jgi:hypothetical protein